MASVADPFEPRDNILAGAAYLREMFDRYGDVGAMLAAYNAGPDRTDDYLAFGRPLPAETRAYVATIAPALGAAPLSDGGLPGADVTDWREAPLFVARGPDASDAAPMPGADAESAALVAAGGAADAPATENLRAPIPGWIPPMSADHGSRVLARSGVDRRARRGKAGNPTEGWQDKRPHGVRRSVGCFDWVFRRLRHAARLRRRVLDLAQVAACLNTFCTLRSRLMADDREFRVRPGRIRSTRAQAARPFIAQALAAAQKAGGQVSRTGRIAPAPAPASAAAGWRACRPTIC